MPNMACLISGCAITASMRTERLGTPAADCARGRPAAASTSVTMPTLIRFIMPSPDWIAQLPNRLKSIVQSPIPITRSLDYPITRFGSRRILTHNPEGEAPCAEVGNQPRRRVDRVPLVLEWRRLVAVMHDDDVAVRDAIAQAVHHRVRRPRAEPVPVP